MPAKKEYTPVFKEQAVRLVFEATARISRRPLVQLRGVPRSSPVAVSAVSSRAPIASPSCRA